MTTRSETPSIRQSLSHTVAFRVAQKTQLEVICSTESFYEIIGSVTRVETLEDISDDVEAFGDRCLSGPCMTGLSTLRPADPIIRVWNKTHHIVRYHAASGTSGVLIKLYCFK